MTDSSIGIVTSNAPAAPPPPAAVFARMKIDESSRSAIDLLELHQSVQSRSGRIELVTPDGRTSVLISKSELDALEQALQILGDTEAVRAMRQEMARVISAVVHTDGIAAPRRP